MDKIYGRRKELATECKTAAELIEEAHRNLLDVVGIMAAFPLHCFKSAELLARVNQTRIELLAIHAEVAIEALIIGEIVKDETKPNKQ